MKSCTDMFIYPHNMRHTDTRNGSRLRSCLGISMAEERSMRSCSPNEPNALWLDGEKRGHEETSSISSNRCAYFGNDFSVVNE